jgi:predicted nucleotidyltransferase
VSDIQLELAADILQPFLDDVVFVGGATIHLWVTDPAAPPVRATDDVDVICDVTTLADYYRLGEQLRERGLTEDASAPVICRWRHTSSGLAIDVMPVSEEVLGFSNPWYGPAIDTAQRHELDSGHVIRVASPPLIVATKLSAWKGRGGGDTLGSLDVHDIVALVDGRPQIAEELAAADHSLRSFVEQELRALRNETYFEYVVDSAAGAYGAAAGARSELLKERLDKLVRRLAS